MFKQLILAVLSFTALPVLCAPVISLARTEGSQIVIEGNGFGSSNPMIFWDDTSSAFQSLSAKSNDIVLTSPSALWQVNTNYWGSPVKYATDIQSRLTLAGPTSSVASTASSSSANVTYFGTGHKNFLGKPNYLSPPKTSNTLYVSWWYKPSMHPNAEGGSNKFIRIWDDPNGRGTRVSWTQMHVTCNDAAVSWRTWAGKVNGWNHHEFYINMPKKKIVAKVNGVTYHDINNCEKSAEFPNKPIYIEVLGFDHGSSSYQNMTTSLDDIYIGDTQARVVVSRNHEWTANIETEVLPIKSWANNKIVAQDIDGFLFKGEDRRYLYVILADGTVNLRGHPLKCFKCPSPPKPQM